MLLSTVLRSTDICPVNLDMNNLWRLSNVAAWTTAVCTGNEHNMNTYAVVESPTHEYKRSVNNVSKLNQMIARHFNLKETCFVNLKNNMYRGDLTDISDISAKFHPLQEVDARQYEAPMFRPDLDRLQEALKELEDTNIRLKLLGSFDANLRAPSEEEYHSTDSQELEMTSV